MALQVNNDIKLKKCYVGEAKCKKIFVNGEKVWSAEESFSKQISNVYYNNAGSWGPDTNGDGSPDSWNPSEDKYSDFTVANITIPVGDTFRIDKIVVQCPNSTTTNIVLVVNGTTALDVIPNMNQLITYGPYPSASGVYTSTTDVGTIQFKIRGKSDQSQWAYAPTGYLTINYTTGV